jgi:3-oxoacyl-[acyl-carrier protein] reductase
VKIAVVTGASRGIGKAIALKLAKENYKIMLFGRDEKLLNEVKIEISKENNTSDVFVGDVTDENFVEESICRIIEKYGQIDVLINNAGVMITNKFVDSTLKDFKTQVETNLYGVYNFIKAVLPSMIERKDGTIINIASIAGKNPVKGASLYSATKHALMGLSRSLMLEVREFNIRVSTVCPGSVDTDLLTNTLMAPSNPGKILQIEDVADVVALMINMPVRALVNEIEIRPTNPG